MLPLVSMLAVYLVTSKKYRAPCGWTTSQHWLIELRSQALSKWAIRVNVSAEIFISFEAKITKFHRKRKNVIVEKLHKLQWVKKSFFVAPPVHSFFFKKAEISWKKETIVKLSPTLLFPQFAAVPIVMLRVLITKSKTYRSPSGQLKWSRTRGEGGGGSKE